MMPATPASRPDTMPRNNAFLNMLWRFTSIFSNGYGYFHLDIVADLAAGLADLEVIAVDGERAGEGAARGRFLKGKGEGSRFGDAVGGEVAGHLVAAGSLCKAFGDEGDRGIFCRIEPFRAHGVFILQAVAG